MMLVHSMLISTPIGQVLAVPMVSAFVSTFNINEPLHDGLHWQLFEEST